MMYGLSMSIDGSMELFNISNTMVDSIIEDIRNNNGQHLIKKNDNEISIFKENSEVIYFYRNHDRKIKAIEFLGNV